MITRILNELDEKDVMMCRRQKPTVKDRRLVIWWYELTF